MLLFRCLLVFQVIMTAYGAEVTFGDVRTLKLDVDSLDVQIGVHPDNKKVVVSDLSKQTVSKVLDLSQANGVLYVRYKSGGAQRPKVRIMLPNNCKLDMSVSGNSRVFVPKMISPLRVTAKEYSEVTISGCVGCVVRQGDASKVHVKYLLGDTFFSIKDKAQLGVADGKITTSIMNLRNEAKASISASINSIKLETRGKSQVVLDTVLRTLIWVGWGTEQVLVKNVKGTADLMGNYNTRFTVKQADLSMLYASTSTTAKIKIGGTVKNAALSVRGASEIVIDKLTGNLLRKNKSSKGSIKVLNR